MDIIKEVEKKKKEYFTDSYPMSIGEIINLYDNDEILLNPDFQRYFRWSTYQKSRFVESILLGIPIPAIFVYQRKDGVWELVDGLQRISTILEFIGILKNDGQRVKPLKLEATDSLPVLQDMMWDYPKREDKSFPQPLKLQFKRSKLDVNIIMKESDVDAKFDVFERLNTGGSFLSDQEVRNSLLVMLNKKIFSWFISLAENKYFLDCISISDRLIQEQYNVELVLRYLSCSKYDYDRRDVGKFLTDSLKKIVQSRTFDFDSEKQSFNKLFKLLNRALGEDCFKKYDGNKFSGKFLESAFEAITLGVGANLNSYTEKDIAFLSDKIQKMWSNSGFTKYSGSGSNARQRIPNLLEFSKRYFSK